MARRLTVQITSLLREPRDDVAEVRFVECRVLVDLPREESLAQRAEGNEADAEFLEGRQHVFFGPAPPQRVFTLHCRDRLDRVRTADRLRACSERPSAHPLASPLSAVDAAVAKSNRR